MKLDNKVVHNILSVICIISEIVNWVSVGLYILLFILSLISAPLFEFLMVEGRADMLMQNPTFAAFYDYEGNVNMLSVYVHCIYGAINLSIKALVFRNINIILDTLSKKHNNTKNHSPFQESVVKRVKTIGILFIASPVFDYIADAILYFSSDTISQITGDAYCLTLGLICFCLAHILSYGSKLEDEVDGLL